jgi:hypothetical protein
MNVTWAQTQFCTSPNLTQNTAIFFPATSLFATLITMVEILFCFYHRNYNRSHLFKIIPHKLHNIDYCCRVITVDVVSAIRKINEGAPFGR